MSDIHGFRDSFIKMVERINLRAEDTLYILGDVIDRGPEPIALLQLVMREKNMLFLLGNHEDMLLNYLTDGSLERWMRNGGGVTLKQWEEQSLPTRLEMADFLLSCPLYRKVDHYLLVHSGLIVPKEMREDDVDSILAVQEKNHLVWSREDFFNRAALDQTVVVFGHTSTACIRASRNLPVPVPFTIWHDELFLDKIGIDCGSYNPQGGQLGCLRLDDLQEFYLPTHF